MSIYNDFAKDYDLKRKKPWKPLVKFYNSLKLQNNSLDGIILDAGCGNGRNIDLFLDHNSFNKIVGLDNSKELLKIAKNKNAQFILADLNLLPFRASSLNSMVAIASFHHIAGKENRFKFMQDINEIINVKGYFLISVWKRWQKRFMGYFLRDWIKRKFSKKYRTIQKKKGLLDFGDIFVPWKTSGNQEESIRFYHLFSKREITKLLKSLNLMKFSTIGGPSNKDNFFIFAKKREMLRNKY